MKESDLTKKMVGYLKSRGAWARKIHGNMYTAGLPDIIACYRGWCLGLEVKMPGREKTLTGIQKATLDNITQADGFGMMVTSVSQVEKILTVIDRIQDA